LLFDFPGKEDVEQKMRLVLQCPKGCKVKKSPKAAAHSFGVAFHQSQLSYVTKRTSAFFIRNTNNCQVICLERLFKEPERQKRQEFLDCCDLCNCLGMYLAAFFHQSTPNGIYSLPADRDRKTNKGGYPEKDSKIPREKSAKFAKAKL
jgi:hypothetical protein